MNRTIRKSMLLNSSVYISCHPVRLADKNCDVSVITLYPKQARNLARRIMSPYKLLILHALRKDTDPLLDIQVYQC